MASFFLWSRGVASAHARLLADVRRPARSDWHAAGHVAHRQAVHDWDDIVKDWNAAVNEVVPLFEEDDVSTSGQEGDAQRAETTNNVASHAEADNVVNSAPDVALPNADHVGARLKLFDEPSHDSSTSNVQPEPAGASTSVDVRLHAESPSLSADPEPAPPTAGTIGGGEDAREHAVVQKEDDGVADSGSGSDRPASFSAASQVLSGLARPWGQDTKPAPEVGAATESTQRETEAALVKQGMSSLKAESLALHLHGTNSPYANVGALDSKLESLRQLLPGLDICSLVLRDYDVLTTDVDKAVPRLICIKTVLGEDLIQLVSRNPVLLYGEDVEECLRNAWRTLTRILPEGYPRESIKAALQTEPLLIFRLEHYHAVETLEELPLDVQQLFKSNTSV